MTYDTSNMTYDLLIYDTRFPSGKRLGEWRKNETKSIQRETNTTSPEIEEQRSFSDTWYELPGNTLINKRTLHFRTGRYLFSPILGDKLFGVT